ncbi:MarR family winged helix-turn-helix transcriptional regulator [Streptomyces sp. CBMA29]|uniref:MarR family winged helix-turn-helix transcriptional regulator n=1 Tax=Streptomyces sp. CBMA29 TaxID=1896314 RepID=UPI001661EC38|nr:MarR family winged helix-turn-helix transcriptional regulator [Streptomyces sp. CBMA29]MBD0734597.1 MarR family transcriptional regulator [Streptomyces sp. CBMA29]
MSAREASVESIQRELTAFARRARATAARMHPELSLVSFTILAHLEEQQGCRATDLAAHYLLDKSTVSRQVAALERLGYIERRVDPTDHRVQVLHLAQHGIETLAAARVSRKEIFQERLAAWGPEDLARFAEYLVRYNADAAAHPLP